MSTTYMTHDYLLQMELVAAREFADCYRGFETVMPDLLDTLFRLMYFREDQKPAPDDGVQYFVLERCVHLPYSLRATWLLARGGYYPEAATLIRQLLEAFVQLRYFVKFPAQLVPHFTSPTRKNQVSFKVMFDEFAPGYYDAHYRVLASIAHGGAGLTALSLMERATDGTGRMLTPIGCKFDADRSSLIVNYLLMVVSGHLRCFPVWFPSYQRLADAESEAQRVQSLAILAKWRQDHQALHAHSHGWLELSDLLMGAEETKATKEEGA